MGAVRTMKRRGLERERRSRELRHLWGLLKEDVNRIEYLEACNRKLQERLADPEGTIQRGLNERYSRDLRERELEHHASWDAEVVVHKMAAARWMRSCASAVAAIAGDVAIAAEIDRLPLVPSDG